MNHDDENMGLISALSERLLNGIFKENPTFVLLLGMCPTLAVTTSAVNGLGMGVSTMVVLAMSNLIISLLRKVIPDKIRIPAFIVIIASFVTIVELVMKGYVPSLYSALGLYIPLIVVNCIILGRAESYAYSHSALLSLFDGFGMGMGFTFALTIIGAFRELLGSGKVFNAQVMPEGFIPVSIFVMAPGAFFVLAMLTAVQNKIKEIGTAKGRDMSRIQSGCGGNCLECSKDCKVEMPETMKSDIGAVNEAEKHDDEGSVPHKGFAERFKERLSRKSEDPGTKSEEEHTENGKAVEEDDGSHEQKESEDDNKEPLPGGEGFGGVPEGDNEIGPRDNESPDEEQKEPEPEREEHNEQREEHHEEPEEPVKEHEEPSEELHGSDEEHEESPVGADTAESTGDPEGSSEDAAEGSSDVEMWDINDLRSVVKRVLPSGRRPGKSKKAMERAKAMLDRAEGAAKEDTDD